MRRRTCSFIAQGAIREPVYESRIKVKTACFNLLSWSIVPLSLMNRFKLFRALLAVTITISYTRTHSVVAIMQVALLDEYNRVHQIITLNAFKDCADLCRHFADLEQYVPFPRCMENEFRTICALFGFVVML